MLMSGNEDFAGASAGAFSAVLTGAAGPSAAEAVVMRRGVASTVTAQRFRIDFWIIMLWRV